MGMIPQPTGAFAEETEKLLVTDHYIAYVDSPTNENSVLDSSRPIFLEIGFYFCTKTFSTEVRGRVTSTIEISYNAQISSGPAYNMNFSWNPQFYQLDACARGPAGRCAKRFAQHGAEHDEPVSQPRHQGGILLPLTATYRSITSGHTRLRVTPERANLTGTVFAPQTVVSIHWGYISMLAAQLMLASIFLAAAAASTYSHGVQIMKASPLATLCGLGQDTREALGDLNEFEALKSRAAKAKVNLDRESSGAALSLRLAGPRQRTVRRPEPGWT